MRRPTVVIIGAGSWFTTQLARDIMSIPGLSQGRFCLVDLDEARLRPTHAFVEKVNALLGTAWTVHSSTDRRELLPGADYVLCTIEVAGPNCVETEYEIPLKYGIDQCIGDTAGPGGVMKALRTIPTWVDILRDVEALCPQALVMNYTNPMAMLTMAALEASHVQVVGLCHSVQGTSKLLAEFLGVPYDELHWECSGINHLAWFTKVEHLGFDQYPRLREIAAVQEHYAKEPVRFETMLQFGAFVTESSGHCSEYLPYFRKRKEFIEQWGQWGQPCASGVYAKTWPEGRPKHVEYLHRLVAGEEPYDLTRSHEYAADIIEGHWFNRPRVIHGNVRNTGLIPNLPLDGVVEVPVLVDNTGLHPCYVGPLPTQLAALCRAHMGMHNLGVKAALAGDKEAAIHAMMLDPLSAAVCMPAEIRAMAHELFDLETQYLPFALPASDGANS